MLNVDMLDCRLMVSANSSKYFLINFFISLRFKEPVVRFAVDTAKLVLLPSKRKFPVQKLLSHR